MTHFAKILICLTFLFLIHPTYSQFGIGVYPSGTEPGLGFKTSQKAKNYLELKVINWRMNQILEEKSIHSEVHFLHRFNYFNRVNFITGFGPRIEWIGGSNFYGASIPIAVEAFPFPFPNAGLYFEVAPFYTTNGKSLYNLGIRSAAGIVFFFTRKENSKQE